MSLVDPFLPLLSSSLSPLSQLSAFFVSVCLQIRAVQWSSIGAGSWPVSGALASCSRYSVNCPWTDFVWSDTDSGALLSVPGKPGFQALLEWTLPHAALLVSWPSIPSISWPSFPLGSIYQGLHIFAYGIPFSLDTFHFLGKALLVLQGPKGPPGLSSPALGIQLVGTWGWW